MDYGKLLRTLQNYAPGLKPAKDAFYRNVRRFLRVPHEADFRVLADLRRGPDEILIDVGANHGQSIESMRLFQPHMPVVAFEANADLSAALARRYADRADVRIETCGLGDKTGHLVLFVPSYNGFVYDGLASTDRREAQDWLGPDTLFGFDQEKLTIAEQRCRIATLDSFNLQPAFIKIDVQGPEHAVLEGARQTIERCRPAVLLEGFETDPRTGILMRSLGYGIFHVTAGRVAHGPGLGPNTLLLPADRPRF